MQVFLCMFFKIFLTNLDWEEYEDSVSDKSPFVIGNSNTLKFQCLLVDLKVLIGPYSKFY